MNFKQFTSPQVLKRNTAGGGLKKKKKRMEKQIYEQKNHRLRLFLWQRPFRVERRSLGLGPGLRRAAMLLADPARTGAFGTPKTVKSWVLCWVCLGSLLKPGLSQSGPVLSAECGF